MRADPGPPPARLQRLADLAGAEQFLLSVGFDVTSNGQHRQWVGEGTDDEGLAPLHAAKSCIQAKLDMLRAAA